jgi:hypothetical protein
MSDWSDRWRLRFHPEKCKHVIIGRGNDVGSNEYILCDAVLENVESEKDIGVTIYFQLKFEEHIGNKVRKANSEKEFPASRRETCILLYKALAEQHEIP